MLLEGTGLCASKPISPGSARGQQGSRWTIHASRQLSDKVLRYLKRVRVTPAVYGPFFLLDEAFRYPHWAGFSGNTHAYALAAAYVFIKQSEPPSHCDLLLQRAGTPSPEVTGLVCRVPSGGLVRHALGFSPRGTCVSSRYGYHRPNHVLFTGTWNQLKSPQLGTPSHLHPLLAITALRGLKCLDGATAPLSLSRYFIHGI